VGSHAETENGSKDAENSCDRIPLTIYAMLGDRSKALSGKW